MSQIFLNVNNKPTRIGGSCRGKVWLSGTKVRQLAIYGSCLSSVRREGFSMTWNGNMYLHLSRPSGRINLYERPLQKPQCVPLHCLFYFGLISEDENRCPWLLCCLKNAQQVHRPDGAAEPLRSLGRKHTSKSSGDVKWVFCRELKLIETKVQVSRVCDRLNLTEIIPAVIGDSDVSGSSWNHGHFVVSKRSAWQTETLV